MSVTDPIADMATLIRNASGAGKEKVDIKASRVNEKILKILKDEKFIQNYKRIPDNKQGILRVYLMYGEASSGQRISKDEKKPLYERPRITNIKRISKPGLRVYKNKRKIASVLEGLGIAIISTSEGILTDKQVRERNLGGEIMLEVW